MMQLTAFLFPFLENRSKKMNSSSLHYAKENITANKKEERAPLFCFNLKFISKNHHKR